MNIRISGINEESFTDGTGIRYAVFTQGCTHNCFGCHNPDSHDISGGTSIDIETLVSDIKSNPMLDGVTLSGGDPLCQLEETAQLIKRIKEETSLNIWLYTGYTLDYLLDSDDSNIRYIIDNTDVIIDGPFVLSERDLTLKFKGSKNQRIIDIKSTLESNKIILVDLGD